MQFPLKASRWWSHKIPPLLAVAYFALSLAPRPPDFTGVRRYFALYLLAVVAIAAFGHLLTDAFDVEEDRLLDKQNLWAPMPFAARWTLIAVLLLASWLPWLAMPGRQVLIGLIALQFVMFFLYAAPPVRLKERGFPGILADATYAHMLPTLWTWVAFSTLSGVRAPAWLVGILSLWSLSVGIRHLLQHQVAELESDSRLGIATHAVRSGRASTVRLIVRPFLLMEIMSFAVILVIVGSRLWLVPAGFLVFAGVRLVRMSRVSSLRATRDDAELSAAVGTLVLTRFYERWLPLLILTGLVLRERSYIVLLVLHLVLFGRGVVELLRDDLPRMAGALGVRRGKKRSALSRHHA